MDEKLLTGYESTIPDGGTMGKLIRSYDWSQTSVGAIENWLPSLKTAVRIILRSRFPMVIWWGQSELNFYNDAYIQILGARHPDALGQPGRQVWGNETWDAVTPQIEGVLQEGQASWDEALFVMTQRNGYLEESYFTFSMSPILEEGGSLSGILCVITEETRRVLSDRRLVTLRQLAAETAKIKSVEDVGAIAVKTVEQNPQDLPFALLYLLDEIESKARLISATESIARMSICPTEVELEDNGNDLWSLKKGTAGESGSNPGVN